MTRPMAGFTLIEMSIVLIIIGSVMMATLPALTMMRVSTQRTATRANLDALYKATALYVQVNGCFPCPTPASTVGTGFGRVRGDSATNAVACKKCTESEGVPPYISLGITPAAARDGWGHWITMRVDPVLTDSFGVIPPYSPCTALDTGTECIGQEGLHKKGLCKAGLSTSSSVNVIIPGNTTAQKAAVVFVSHGPTGFGAYNAGAVSNRATGLRTPIPNVSATCPAITSSTAVTPTLAKQCNASNTVYFVDAPLTSGYEDILIYGARNNVVSYFNNGTCDTTW